MELSLFWGGSVSSTWTLLLAVSPVEAGLHGTSRHGKPSIHSRRRTMEALPK
ncbi:hypothetical protein SynROS8604_01692 [Synechococcus sp. ROS8604]|nr:hypothetical protein SynROS8604_01692 [Synechococcus sp. ROS8604]